MKTSNVIPCLCVVILFIISPIIQQPKKPLSKNASGVVNSEFSIIVQDIVESKSGLSMCKMFIKDIDKEVIGPCKTTDDVKLEVGYTYTINRANIDGGFININKAKQQQAPLKWEVIETYVSARTPLMKVRNGEIEKVVGNNEGHTVGSFVNVQAN